MEINTVRAVGEIGVMVPEDSFLAQEDKEEILSRIEELRYRLESDFPHIAFFFRSVKVESDVQR